MKTFWLMGANTPDEKAKIKRDFDAAYNAFRILEKFIDGKLKREIPEASYESPSWAYLQADRNGYNRALQEILNVIKQTED